MTLREKQSVFSVLVAKLMLEADRRGYEITLGEAWRPPEMAELYAKQGKGIKNSLHTQRLAIDLNLFKDGVYLGRSEAYRPLGEWWEAQSLKDRYDCCWGGRFGDGNHFSISHGGRR